jgi:uncharacterized protein HemY
MRDKLEDLWMVLLGLGLLVGLAVALVLAALPGVVGIYLWDLDEQGAVGLNITFWMVVVLLWQFGEDLYWRFYRWRAYRRRPVE